MKKHLYFETPTQVAYFDYYGEDDHPRYIGGIAYQDKIICGCCGGIVEIADVYEFTPEGIEPIKVYHDWMNIEEEICGGEKPEILDTAQ